MALKQLGVLAVVASGATGSLREDIHPGELVICDQVIDKTHARANSFFDQGLAVHVEMADPFCPRLRRELLAAGAGLGTKVHDTGTYVCMEGPAFSTRAESRLHRSWGADLIGMTCMPEARLAREAELCYALVALPTDYDCWRPHATPFSASTLLEEILKNLQQASRLAIELLRGFLRTYNPTGGGCSCGQALSLALWTQRERIDPASAQRLGPLIARYL